MKTLIKNPTTENCSTRVLLSLGVTLALFVLVSGYVC